MGLRQNLWSSAIGLAYDVTLRRTLQGWVQVQQFNQFATGLVFDQPS
jgi:DNA-binding transcriptional regulator of glucitol operon